MNPAASHNTHTCAAKQCRDSEQVFRLWLWLKDSWRRILCRFCAKSSLINGRADVLCRNMLRNSDAIYWKLERLEWFCALWTWVSLLRNSHGLWWSSATICELQRESNCVFPVITYSSLPCSCQATRCFLPLRSLTLLFGFATPPLLLSRICVHNNHCGVQNHRKTHLTRSLGFNIIWHIKQHTLNL